ncbi:MAG: hypothetical protein IJ355_02745 [Prevotella sp.]|nr:hypothetical protein [Prevotella sp.]
MIQISLSNINLRAAYHVTSPENGQFVFTTDQGKTYKIGFIQDYMISDDGVYQFFINTEDDFKTAPDKRVRQTVMVVLEEFFRQKEVVLDYICDTGDNRQAARSRIFSSWFRLFANQNLFTLRPMSVKDEGIEFFAAVVLRNDNPRFSNIIDAIQQFEKQIKDKLQ